MKNPIRPIRIKPQKRYFADGDLFYGILNTVESHWGIGQTGFNVSEDGTFEMSDNQPRRYPPMDSIPIGSSHRVPEGWVQSEKNHLWYPTHRALRPGWPGIYDFLNDILWLYDAHFTDPSTSKELMLKLKKGFCSMKGRYGITDKTVIKSNTTRKVLARIGSLC
jgi:hypothetical protein